MRSSYRSYCSSTTNIFIFFALKRPTVYTILETFQDHEMFFPPYIKLLSLKVIEGNVFVRQLNLRSRLNFSPLFAYLSIYYMLFYSR
jgi:hypothetical protein